MNHTQGSLTSKGEQSNVSRGGGGDPATTRLHRVSLRPRDGDGTDAKRIALHACQPRREMRPRDLPGIPQRPGPLHDGALELLL
jgi:hypothetical protein